MSSGRGSWQGRRFGSVPIQVRGAHRTAAAGLATLRGANSGGLGRRPVNAGGYKISEQVVARG